MKLQAVETHLNGNVYVKHQVVIPNNIIEQAGIHGGDDLTAEVDRNGRIVLSRQLLLPKPMKFTYPMFRTAIFNVLLNCPNGATYTEIRSKAPGLPSKPAAMWVSRLIADIALIRERDHESRHVIWKMETRKTNQ